MSEIRPVVKVARDLREIESLYETLLVQAIHKANDRLMPGGEAMVALGGVASHAEWEEVTAAAEFRHYATCTKLDHTRCHFSPAEDDEGEPPLQTLLFWSEQWREDRGYPLGRRPTMASEARFLSWALEWAWETLPEWNDFERDIASARTRMENLVMAGVRAERGVPCMYDECRGVRLVRKLVPARGDNGERIWKLTDWHCPRCRRQWDDERYAAMVTAAHEATKFEDIDGETWCSDDYAARKLGRSVKTIRTWVNRGELSTVCLIVGRRVKFVNLAEAEALDSKKRRREVA